jgi:hypothetical protein
MSGRMHEPIFCRPEADGNVIGVFRLLFHALADSGVDTKNVVLKPLLNRIGCVEESNLLAVPNQVRKIRLADVDSRDEHRYQKKPS